MKIFAKNVWYFVPWSSRFMTPKRRYFCWMSSQSTFKNLEMVWQCEYASPDNSWQLMATACTWQYRHIRLGYSLRRYYMTNLARIGANFRDFKLIVGHINWSYCSPLLFISGPLTVSEQYCGLALHWSRNVCEDCLIITHYVQQLVSARTRKQEVTRYDHVCDFTNELLQRPATSWIQ